MKVASMILLLLTLSITSVCAADAVSPPQGMKIVGQPCLVTFRWPSDGSLHYLEVYASGRVIYSKPAGGDCFALALPPNDYKWRVRKFINGEYREVMDFVSFSVSSEMALRCEGKPGGCGTPGAEGARGWSREDGAFDNGRAGAEGLSGGNGRDGSDVIVTLQDSGDFIHTLVSSGGVSRDFFLSKSSAPYTINAAGGQGGDGGPGGRGGNVDMVSTTYAPDYRVNTGQPGGFFGMGGSGGSGGNGGDGGAGGAVTVTSRGGDFRAYVTVNNGGGKAGRGGPGGPGGSPGGAHGAAGRDGRDGPAGKVIYE
jgi:hypothetical protein